MWVNLLQIFWIGLSAKLVLLKCYIVNEKKILCICNPSPLMKVYEVSSMKPCDSHCPLLSIAALKWD